MGGDYGTTLDTSQGLRGGAWATDPLDSTGRSRGRYGPPTRRPVGEVVHLDRYGHQLFNTLQPGKGDVT
ncbi:MAG: hypothetical protein ACRERE_12370 [Candidatus Entotheonellia bacterium]